VKYKEIFMSLPKHIRDVPEDRRAVAPYNFVELPDQIIEISQQDLPNHDQYHADRLTGRIECTLTTDSPLYIRGGLTPDEYADWGDKSSDQLTPEQIEAKANFFTLATTQPVIPGSSLRGMLRSIIEIITYSKLSKVSDRSLVYRAVANTSILRNDYYNHINQGGGRRAGFMINDGGVWKIQPALPIDSCGNVTLARIRINEIGNLEQWYESKNAFKINVCRISSDSSVDEDREYVLITRIPPDSSKPLRRDQEKPYNAVLIKSGMMPGKKKECIFGLPDPVKDNWISIPTSLSLDYRNQITKEQITLLGKDGVLWDNQPVFYLMNDNKIIFFGHTLMFRLPYEYSIKDFIPPTLKREENLDMAEALFGTVLDHKSKNGGQRAILGRIVISDAYCCQQNENIWLENGNHMITPQILSSPKPTTFQHYLVQTNHSPKKLKHYGSQPVTETVLRGQKLYWHKGRVTKAEISDLTQADESSTQHTKIKPIKPGVDFTFSIDFQNLKDYELGALLWVLDIMQEQDPQYRLSLGMGKPLGMGAVKITYQIYNSDRIQRHQSLFDSNKSQWELAEKMLNPSVYIATFESWIVDRLQAKQIFKEIPRIKTLLKMLFWKENLLEKEQEERMYMGLEEFKNQKILPVPQRVDMNDEIMVDDIIDVIVSSIKIEFGAKSKIILKYIYDDLQLPGQEEIYKFEKKGIVLTEGDKVKLVVLAVNNGDVKKYKLLVNSDE
jgi:CRISPR-associated protein (TIGR03986 family)